MIARPGVAMPSSAAFGISPRWADVAPGIVSTVWNATIISSDLLLPRPAIVVLFTLR